MFEFFTENELISHNQSGFKPRDSCISQLLYITWWWAWDKNRLCPLFTLKQNGISGNLLNFITNFLYQKVKSCFKRIALVLDLCWSRAPQGSILGPIFGPLLFLIYNNDLSDGLTSNPKLFADDICFLLFKI